MLLDGKNVIITGTNRGIGKEILKQCAINGATIYAHTRKPIDDHYFWCKELEREYGIKIRIFHFDAINYEEIKQAASWISKETNRIDVLINNISTITKPQLFHMTRMDDIKLEFDVNLFSQLYFTQFISRIMMKHKSGSIINISSVAGIDGNTGMIGYVSSKAAMIGATKRLAIELGSYNIRVNSIAPGLTNTDMGNMMSEELKDKTLSHQVLEYMAEPIDIANTTVYLGSDLSRHVTGQVIRVDGGMLR